MRGSCQRECPIARSSGVCPARAFDSNAKHRLARSAGACPPRSLRQNEKRPKPGGHGRLLSRSMHGEGQALALRAMRQCPLSYRGAGTCPPRTFDSNEKRRLARSAGACPPRSLRQNEKRPQPGGHGRFLLRPAPGEGQALALR